MFEDHLSPALEARHRDLLSAHARQWAEPLQGYVQYVGFRRGFVEEVGMSGRQFLSNTEPLFRLAPVRHVSFARVPPVLVATLTGSPFLARLRSLSLAHNCIGPRGARCLGDCRHLGRLTSLNLMHCLIGDAGLQALLSSPHLGGLTALDLWNNRLSESSASLLAASPVLCRLEYLSVGCNSFGGEGEQALRERFGSKVTFGLYGEGEER
jgi:hypothetical protein